MRFDRRAPPRRLRRPGDPISVTSFRESNGELLQKANACFAEERWADAAAAFEQALSSQAGSAQDWYRFGVACLELQQTPRAMQWFHKAMSIDPSHGKA